MLKSITLENIRSYREPTTIEFQEGTTLFEGDVASGKSTILSAVEFALFGLGDINGSFLLRNGADLGRVALTFEVEGKDYTVHRSLARKGDNVRSGESFIEQGDEREKLATKELKERVLQILRFNEPSSPKSQSVIYRYAIFTPQEAMREIIERDPGARLETLRKAYGIEQYRTATQNTKSVTNELRVKISGLKGRIGELDRDRQELADLRMRIEGLKVRASDARRTKDTLERELDSKRTAKEELGEKREEIRRAQDRIPLLKRELDEKEKERKASQREVESTENRVTSLAKEIGHLEAAKSPTSKSTQDLDQESRRLEREISGTRDKISRFSERIKNFDDILEKGICPVCEREYETDRVAERRSHIESELVLMKRKDATLQEEDESLRATIEALREFQQAQRDLKALQETFSDLKSRSQEERDRIRALDARISELNEQFREANKAIEPLKKVLAEIEKADDEIRKVEERYSSGVRSLGGIERELETSQADAERRSLEIKEREGLAKRQVALEEDKMWLTDYFAPTVEMIEEQNFANRNRSFNEQFQRWFQVLVDDSDLRVRVKEDFSPVIEREGYEQDYGQLSGGERTSVALAYRLALNTTVQEAALGQEPNLLILDEPTDGFSKEQLAKFGDILTELKCPQVILVSHERELENVADLVYRIEKVNGESTVSDVQ